VAALGPVLALLIGSPAAMTLVSEAHAAPRHKADLPVASGAAIKQPTGAGVFGGMTSQKQPVVVEVSKNGRKVTSAYTVLMLTCTSAPSDPFWFPDDYRALPIRSGGFGTPFTDAFTEGGVLVDVKGAIKGKLNRRRTRITGTWTLSLTSKNAAGATIDTCTSAVRFSARQ